MESFLSNKVSTLSKTDVKNIAEFIDKNFVLKKMKPDVIDFVIDIMKYDKKNMGTQVSFALLKKIGKAGYDYYCKRTIIKEAFRFYNSIAE